MIQQKKGLNSPTTIMAIQMGLQMSRHIQDCTENYAWFLLCFVLFCCSVYLSYLELILGEEQATFSKLDAVTQPLNN